MTGGILPGSNRTSLANCGSPGELLAPREFQDWLGLGDPAVFKATGNEFLGYLVDLCGLQPGGRRLITFFLLNEESSALSKERKGWIKFEHEMQGARTANVENPEEAIAYPEAFVRDLYRECGLELREPLRYGTWCGRTN